MTTWGDVNTSIRQYIVLAYYLKGDLWANLGDSTEMVNGMECAVKVSQDCSLDWNGYHFPLIADVYTYFTWEPIITDDITATIPLTLTIPPSVIEDITAVIPLTLTIPPSIIDDIVATIPLILTIPSIEPPPPPDEDEDSWAAIAEWLNEYWYAVVAIVVVYLIGLFVWARYK